MLDNRWAGDTFPVFINAAIYMYNQEVLEDTSETMSDKYPSKFRDFNVAQVPIN